MRQKPAKSNHQTHTMSEGITTQILGFGKNIIQNTNSKYCNYNERDI